MPDARWMSLVIAQRQQGARLGGEQRPPYGDIDAEPLPFEPDDEGERLASRLTARLRPPAAELT